MVVNEAALVFKRTPKRDTFVRDCRNAGIHCARDERGETVDRHSLRKTFVTWLSVAGVAPRTAQKLARHTDLRLTMQTYTDERLLDGVSEVEKLPDLTTPDPVEAVALRATGTDDNLVVPPVVLRSGEMACDRATASGANKATRAVCSRNDKRMHAGASSRKIGATGLEPATSWTQTRRSSQTELRPVASNSTRTGLRRGTRAAIRVPAKFGCHADGCSLGHVFLQGWCVDANSRRHGIRPRIRSERIGGGRGTAEPLADDHGWAGALPTARPQFAFGLLPSALRIRIPLTMPPTRPRSLRPNPSS